MHSKWVNCVACELYISIKLRQELICIKCLVQVQVIGKLWILLDVIPLQFTSLHPLLENGQQNFSTMCFLLQR